MGNFSVNPTALKNAYWYLLTRAIVIRQEINDIKETPYNQISHKKIDLDDIAFVNPNFDVVYSDAWLAIDPFNAVIMNVPQITDRYYTVQLMNGWGETIANINERNYPHNPFGKFAIVLENSTPEVPSDATVITVQSPKIKILIRVEIKGDLNTASKLQHQFTLDVPNNITIDTPPNIPDFPNDQLMGAEIFTMAKEIINSAKDTFTNAQQYQKDALETMTAINNSQDIYENIEESLKQTIIPDFFIATQNFRTIHGGWYSGYVDKNNTDNLTRLMINYIGLWANIAEEVVYFLGFVDSDLNQLNGSYSYSITFPKNELPDTLVEAYWSLTALSLPDYLILPNDLNKYSINNMLDFVYNEDGSLTLWLSSELPEETQVANWMPIIKDKPFNLNFRLYVPKDKALSADFFPPYITRLGE